MSCPLERHLEQRIRELEAREMPPRGGSLSDWEDRAVRRSVALALAEVLQACRSEAVCAPSRGVGA